MRKINVVCCFLLATLFIICTSCKEERVKSGFGIITLDLKSGGGIRRSIDLIRVLQNWTQARYYSINDAEASVEAVLQQKIEKKHPEIIDKIIHLQPKEKREILQKGSTIYNLTYKKLSATEQKEIDKLIKMPGYLTVRIPNSIKTVNEAIKYLKNQQSEW